MNNKQFTYVAILLLFLGSVIGGVVGNYEANYTRQMCNEIDMDSLDFDLNLEISGETQKDCFRANNYKLYDVGIISESAVVGFVFAVLIDLIILVIILINEEN